VIVGQPVGGVVVLGCVEVTLRLAGKQVFGGQHGAIGAVLRRGQHDLRPVGAQNLDALRAGVFRQKELDGVAARRAEHGQGDAGVAAGALQDRLAGVEQAGGLGLADDIERGAILDAPAGVVPFRLGVDGDGLRQAAGDPLQADQRGIADQLLQRAGFRPDSDYRVNKLGSHDHPCGAQQKASGQNKRAVAFPMTRRLLVMGATPSPRGRCHSLSRWPQLFACGMTWSEEVASGPASDTGKQVEGAWQFLQ